MYISFDHKCLQKNCSQIACVSDSLQTIERNLYRLERKISDESGFPAIRTDPLSKPDAIQFLYILVSIYLSI